MYCLMYPMYSKTLQTLHHTGYIDNHEQKSILCIWQFRFLCFSQGWFKIDHTSVFFCVYLSETNVEEDLAPGHNAGLRKPKYSKRRSQRMACQI